MREVIREFGPLGFLPLNHHSRKLPLRAQMIAQTAQKRGILGQPLGQNVARAGQRSLGVGHGVRDEPRGQPLRVRAAVCEQTLQQRLQPILARDHRLCAALGLEGQIQIFKHRLGFRPCKRTRQSVRQLALLGHRFHNGRAPLFQLAQVSQPLFERAQLRVIQAPRHFLAVARDEGHGRAIIQKRDGRLHLRGRGRDILGNAGGNGGKGHGRPVCCIGLGIAGCPSQCKRGQGRGR